MEQACLICHNTRIVTTLKAKVTNGFISAMFFRTDSISF
jgi:hypothetical protein